MRDERLIVHLIANAYWEALDFELPQIGRLACRGAAGSIPVSPRPRISFTGKLRYQFHHPPYGPNRGR
jgi:hypothetical protein